MGGGQSSQSSTIASNPAVVQAGNGKKPDVAGGPPAKVGENKEGDVVVIAVDASKQAETAFRWYVEHVHKPENEVRIIHCRDYKMASPTPSAQGFSQESWQEMLEQAEKEGRKLCSRYEDKLRDEKINGTVKMELGHPGQTLVNAANQYRAAQIVMGTRGYGVVRRTILGSVSQYVIHHTSVPVTVIPEETQSWFF